MTPYAPARATQWHTHDTDNCAQAVVKTLLQMKSEELDYYKEKLADMRANNVMRINLNELLLYLNARRDTELHTFRVRASCLPGLRQCGCIRADARACENCVDSLAAARAVLHVQGA